MDVNIFATVVATIVDSSALSAISEDCVSDFCVVLSATGLVETIFLLLSVVLAAVLNSARSLLVDNSDCMDDIILN